MIKKLEKHIGANQYSDRSYIRTVLWYVRLKEIERAKLVLFNESDKVSDGDKQFFVDLFFNGDINKSPWKKGSNNG